MKNTILVPTWAQSLRTTPWSRVSHLRLFAVWCALYCTAWTYSVSSFAQQVSPVSDFANGDARELSGDEKRQALKMLVGQLRGNDELIQTWKGSYNFTDRFRFEGSIPGNKRENTSESLPPGEIPTGESAGSGYWEITQGIAEFSLDKTIGSYHVFYQPQKPLGFIDIATGNRYQWETFGDSIHWIFTPEHSLEFDTKHTSGQFSDFVKVASVPPTGGRVVHRRTVEETASLSRVFDPRKFFHADGSPYWEYCEFIAGAMEGKQGEDGVTFAREQIKILVQEFPHPMYKMVTDHRSGRQTEIIFDGRVGFNVIRWQRTNQSKSEGERRITYREVSGSFIPESFDITIYTQSAGGLIPSTMRSAILQDVELNRPISAAEFGTDQFNLSYGERMLDKINNRLMVYDKNSGFITAEEFVFDPSRLGIVDKTREGATRSRSLIFLLIANGTIILVIVGYMLYRAKHT
ncbi:MAG: hypothetical protein AABP62_13860 [Planctomycetota bacterium]